MSESLAKQLVNELKEALSAGELKSLAIGKAIFDLQKSKAYVDLGYKTFGAFISSECKMQSATATRYAYKYELSTEYPEHRDKIGSTFTVVCEVARRMMNLDGGKEKVDALIDNIDKMSVDEINKIYSGAKPTTNDLKFKRVGLTFTEQDHAEFKELEDVLTKAYDFGSRTQVILNAMRELSVEARAKLENEGAKS